MKPLKVTQPQLHPRAILSDEIVAAVVAQMPKVFGDSFNQLFNGREADIENNLRFRAVAVRCLEARETAGLNLKAASLALKIPQYKLKDIESGSLWRIDPNIFHRYLEFLGLRRWYGKWAKANPKLAMTLQKE